MAKNLNDRISTAVWSPLEYTLFGLITDNLGEGVTVRVSSPYVRDISNKQFRPQGVLGGVLSSVERRRLSSLSDFLILLVKRGANVGLMTAPTGSARFGKTNENYNRAELELLEKLVMGGVEVRMHHGSHSKFVTSPVAEVLLTANLTNRAMFWQIEQATYTSSKDPGFEQARTSNNDMWEQGELWGGGQ